MNLSYTYLLCLYQVLKKIRAIATSMPILEIVHMQMKSGNDRVLRTLRTTVRS